MFERYFVQKAIKLATKRSVYGDIVIDPAGAKKTYYVRFRVIQTAIHVNNREERRSDEAMIWFKPDADISQNDILLCEGQYWEIVKINEARRGHHTNVEFLKCWVSSHQVVS